MTQTKANTQIKEFLKTVPAKYAEKAYEPVIDEIRKNHSKGLYSQEYVVDLNKQVAPMTAEFFAKQPELKKELDLIQNAANRTTDEQKKIKETLDGFRFSMNATLRQAAMNLEFEKFDTRIAHVKNYSIRDNIIKFTA